MIFSVNLFLHWGSHIRETSRFLIFTSGIAFCAFGIFSVLSVVSSAVANPLCPSLQLSRGGSLWSSILHECWRDNTSVNGRSQPFRRRPFSCKWKFIRSIHTSNILIRQWTLCFTECCKLLCWEYVRFATGKVVYIPSWVPTLFRNADLIKSLKSTTCTRTDQEKFPCSSSVYQNLQAARKIRIEDIKWRKVRWFVGLDLTALNSC